MSTGNQLYDEISPDPSLPKRGIQLAPDIFIIIPPLEKGGKRGFEKANKDARTPFRLIPANSGDTNHNSWDITEFRG
jgi:hypothetical protein